MIEKEVATLEGCAETVEAVIQRLKEIRHYCEYAVNWDKTNLSTWNGGRASIAGRILEMLDESLENEEEEEERI